MPATLRVLAAELAGVNEDKITRQMRDEFAKAARPLAPMVRAAILNTPAKGPKHTGLRLRIARCVQTWAEIHPGGIVSVGVEVNSDRMPNGQKSLPLMLQGAKEWRHPVFGNIEVWVTQPSHPYFWDAVAWYGPASQRALERIALRIADEFNTLNFYDAIEF